jgi:hypothetical protein
LESSHRIFINSVTASLPLLEALFQGEKPGGGEFSLAKLADFTAKGFALASTKIVSVRVNTKVEQASTQNVVGVIEGNEPINSSFARIIFTMR